MRNCRTLAVRWPALTPRPGIFVCHPPRQAHRSPVAASLEAHLQGRESRYVSEGREQGLISTRQIQRLLDEAAEKAGLQEMRPGEVEEMIMGARGRAVVGDVLPERVAMGRSFESVRMGVKEVLDRWLKARRALKKRD